MAATEAPVAAAQAMLHRAGLEAIERQILPHDPTNVRFVARKGMT